MAVDIMYILALCAPILLAIGATLGFIRYVKNEKKQRLITWFLLLSVVLELASRYARITIENNLYFLTLSALIEFSFYAMLFYWLIPLKKQKWIVVILCSVALYLLVQVVTLSINVEPNHFNLYDRLIADGSIMILALVYLKNNLTSSSDIPRRYKTLNAFILLYMVVDMFMSLTINFMVNASISLVFFFWFTRLIFLLLLYFNLVNIVWNNGSGKKRKLFG